MIVAFTLLNERNQPTYRSSVRVFRRKGDIERAQSLIDNGHLEYRWPDQDVTRVMVRRVDSPTARRIRSRNSGFLSYEWMIDSALLHGRPLNKLKGDEE